MKNSHEKTCEIIGKCLEETNKEYRKKIDNVLKRKTKKGALAKFRYFLFNQPYLTTLSSIITVYIFIFLAFLIGILFESLWIRLAFIIIYIIFSLGIPILLAKFTPKVQVRWDKKWKDVLKKYLEKTKLQNGRDDKSKAKQKFNRAILYYSREGKPVKFLVNLLWGGIIIGCLPDPAFQKALITNPPDSIWNANPLGTIGLILLPLVYIINSVRYDIPVAWLENVLAQIELEE